MRDCDVVIVSTGGEKGIPLVILDVPDGVCVVAEHLVGHGGQVKVVTLDPLVVGPSDQIVNFHVPLGGRARTGPGPWPC